MPKNTKMRVSKALLDKYQPTLHCRFERWFLSSSEIAVGIFPPRLTNTETRGKQLKTLTLFSRKSGKTRFPLFTRQYYEPILLFFFLRNLRVLSRPNFPHFSWFLPTLDSIDVFYSGLFHYFFMETYLTLFKTKYMQQPYVRHLFLGFFLSFFYCFLSPAKNQVVETVKKTQVQIHVYKNEKNETKKCRSHKFFSPTGGKAKELEL